MSLVRSEHVTVPFLLMNKWLIMRIHKSSTDRQYYLVAVLTSNVSRT
jgi:hypothetical protein